MIVGGFQRFSLIDYPGKISAVIFTRQCNFRCKYCHNPELVLPERYSKEISVSSIFDFLESRRNKLDAVTISGGEPTEHKDLSIIIRDIKNMGFLVKLDTNGSRPEILEKLIVDNLIDYLAMDIKAPFTKYNKITGVPVKIEKIKESIDIIMSSKVEYEFRTTVVKKLLNKEDLLNIAKGIKGAKRYYIQKYIFLKSFKKNPNLSSYSEKELEDIAFNIKKYVKKCRIR